MRSCFEASLGECIPLRIQAKVKYSSVVVVQHTRLVSLVNLPDAQLRIFRHDLGPAPYEAKCLIE